MIQQSIKKYDEPEQWKPTVVTKTTEITKYGGYKDINMEEVHRAIAVAQKLGIKVGDKYKYKSSPSTVEVIGFVEDEKDVYWTDRGYTVIKGKRHGPMAGQVSDMFTYTLSELLNGNLEKVEND